METLGPKSMRKELSIFKKNMISESKNTMKKISVSKKNRMNMSSVVKKKNKNSLHYHKKEEEPEEEPEKEPEIEDDYEQTPYKFCAEKLTKKDEKDLKFPKLGIRRFPMVNLSCKIFSVNRIIENLDEKRAKILAVPGVTYNRLRG